MSGPTPVLDPPTSAGVGSPSRVRKCQAMCSACGRCFTGDGAFDLHRSGPPEDRRCSEVESDPRFYSVNGRCEMYREKVAARIYALARDRGRAAAHFGGREPESGDAEAKVIGACQELVDRGEATWE